MTLSFTVVVPTYNRPRPLDECLAALVALDHPRDHFEIVVVDDGSPMPVDELVRRHADRSGVSVRLIRQPNAGPASARNTGAAAARHDFLAFTDDDCRPRTDWLTALARELALDPQCAVGGHTVNALVDDRCAAASQLLIDFLYGELNDSSGAAFVASNNLALSAAAFRTLGGFDTSFPRAAGEDRELCDRWIGSGRRIRYVPDAIVDHAHAMDLRKFLRQHYGYGTGAVAFHAARAARGNGRIEVEHPSFYLRLLTYPLRTRGVRRPLAACALLATSQVANALGFAHETWRWRRRGVAVEGGDRPSDRGDDAVVERIETVP